MVLWTQRARGLLHWCEMELHWCKKGFGWCTRLLGDLCSLSPKESKGPFTPSPNRFWRFPLTLQSLPFWKKQGFFPQKAMVFLFAEALKSLEKKGKTHKKARKIGNRKKQGLEGQGPFWAISQVCSQKSLDRAYVGPVFDVNLFLGFEPGGFLGGAKKFTVCRARERHINFEHINFLKVGTTLGQPAG